MNQSGQARSFTYDSLGRLTQAVNVENGLTCYSYDNDGNLSTRLQAAASNCSPSVGVLTSYNYDYLNRLTSKVMPEGTATYAYDQGAYGQGRLYSSSFGNSTTTYGVHDAFGRVTSHTQTVDGVPYTFGYTYNGSNNLTSISYPSGRTVVPLYDTAGRVSQVTSNGVASAGSVTYAAHGPVSSFQFANGLWETTNYNSRLQAQQISLGSCAQTTGPGNPACSQSQWWLQNTYSTANNNGNVQQQTIGLPGGIQIPEAYSYDNANRLLVASEQSSNPSNPACPDSGARYVEGFQYDVWGNRTVPCLTGLGPSSLAPSSFSSSNNRITSTGWAYDSAGLGNIVQEPSSGNYRMYLYDSENRQIAFCTQDPGGCVNADGPGRTRYLYDADGRRVEKRDSTGVTVYVYDIQGNLAAEYSTETAAAGSATEYLTADHLGTTRVVTGAGGTIVARRDYRPFGEEIVPSGSDPRVGVTGYLTSGSPSDMGTTLKFTGKEREDPVNSSGLDYFGARYFSSAEGRWTSPDRINITNKRLVSPSSTLNKYAYAANNPLRYYDPNGEDITVFYRRGTFDTGHVLLVAVNQQTGAAAVLDYWPNSSLPLPGMNLEPVALHGVTVDRLREHASLTIQTTPEEAQKVIDFIKKFQQNPPPFRIPTSDCTTACEEALRVLGIDVDKWSPDDLWAQLYAMYSSEAMKAREKLGNPFFAPIGLPAKPGQEYGNPRFSGADFDYDHFLVQLLMSQGRPIRGCVTIPGPKGPETTCDQ